MGFESVWISGPSRSGKTTELLKCFRHCVDLWRASKKTDPSLVNQNAEPPLLVLAATGDNRLELAQGMDEATERRYAVKSTTALGFFQEEVSLFWPLLIESLNLPAQYPLQLRPETEQELATLVWHPHLDEENWPWLGVNEYRLVRNTLDLMQLAAVAGIEAEQIPEILRLGLPDEPSPGLWHFLASLQSQWRQWCLQRGLLTYGIICELYWRHLLPNPIYQSHLLSRYRWVLADDVDEYPAIARHLFDFLLDRGVVGAFTFNPEGGVRLGLGADPNYLGGLPVGRSLRTIELSPPMQGLGALRDGVVELVMSGGWGNNLGSIPEYFAPEESPAGEPNPEKKVFSIQTVSRGEMLRQMTGKIAEAVRQGVAPEDIAIVAAGLDEIARYTITQSLTGYGVPVYSLNDQRPLASSPMIRALLTMLALVYPGLGRLVDRDAVAEMLVILSGHLPNQEAIDPVRAGLLADRCYVPAIEPSPQGSYPPQLLPVTAFPRWDRVGYSATAAYNQIVQWLTEQRTQLKQHLITNPLIVLDRASQKFLLSDRNLPFDQLAALRELMETAAHYWEVRQRLNHHERQAPDYVTVGQFIKMLRQGTVTANPFPVTTGVQKGVTIANIYQYRVARCHHSWHFWIDVGSPLWSQSGAASLLGSQLFLREWSGQPRTAEDEQQADAERLRRILLDLLSRVGDRLYLCHSDLSTSGQEQTGPLLAFINAII
ncbi:recombinase family protein [[Phormidium] sp. ETS-05]|uniref:recombinase family protein n=1 Tax=[Phormidium] sp. ETS-05 TaxID=222819 RepID=UPI0018EED0F1|nr:recombinase family protein [[Phormidium] sp. ETS-05]